jgi:non-ribosomal peptide synthetase component E (peptide arylation enzyme)
VNFPVARSISALAGVGSLCLDDVTRHFVESGVARQKAPEHLRVVTELPRTPAGKVKKFELRKRLRQEPS